MKRAKGKERKAKAEAQRVVTGEGGWEQLVRWGVCKHECTIHFLHFPPSAWWTHLFCFLEWNPSGTSTGRVRFDGSNVNTWRNHSITTLLYGTTKAIVSWPSIFCYPWEQIRYWPRVIWTLLRDYLAFPALFLETYDGTGDFGLVLWWTQGQRRETLWEVETEMWFVSTPREVQLYMLEGKIAATKSQPKIGKCYHCSEEKERSSLGSAGKCTLLVPTKHLIPNQLPINLYIWDRILLL